MIARISSINSQPASRNGSSTEGHGLVWLVGSDDFPNQDFLVILKWLSRWFSEIQVSFLFQVEDKFCSGDKYCRYIFATILVEIW